jgi:hypothetical protein
MFERDRHAHLEVLFMGGRGIDRYLKLLPLHNNHDSDCSVRGRTLGDTFVQVFLHAMIQENSRIGLKRLKVRNQNFYFYYAFTTVPRLNLGFAPTRL